MENKDYQYYQDCTRWSNSMFSALESNEVSFKEWLENPISEIKDVFANGQYLHSCMLELCRPYCTTEPEKDENVYVVKPTGLKLTTKEGKARWAELTEGKEDGTYYSIAQEDAERIDKLTKEFFNDYLKEILESAKFVAAEIAFFGSSTEILPMCSIDLPLRAKADLVITDEFGRTVVIDWKSTSNYSDFKKKATYSYSYARQAYMYAKLASAQEFSFVVFDTTAFNRWKIVDVDLKGDFFLRGQSKTLDGVILANTFLSEGTSADIFKSETL